MRTAVLTLACALSILTACSDLIAPGSEQGGTGAEMAVAVNLANAPEITAIRLRVSADDLPETLQFPLPITNGIASGAATVPVGPARTFTLQALDAMQAVRYQGSTTVDVVSGTNPPLVIVMLPAGPVGEVPITGHIGTFTVHVTPMSADLEVGERIQLAAVVRNALGAVISNASVSWESLNPGIASVSSTGEVRALFAGTASITAKSNGASASATITVAAPDDDTPPPPAPPLPVDPREPVFDPSIHKLVSYDDFNYPSITDLGRVWRVHSPGTLTFGPNDPWTDNKSVKISYSGSGAMYRGIARYGGFQNLGSGRGADVLIVEIGVRYTGDLFEGKEVDMLGGSEWRFDWKPIGDNGARFGHRSISCAESGIAMDPFKQKYFSLDNRSIVPGNAPSCGYHTPNTYLTGAFTSYIYKQNVNWGFGSNQFDLRRNASMDGQGTPINDGRWRIFKIRIERRTGGQAVGDGRYEMWVGFEHGQLLKIMEYDGARGQRDEGYVWIGTDDDALLTTVRLYELSSNHWRGSSSQIYIGYWRAWTP